MKWMNFSFIINFPIQFIARTCLYPGQSMPLRSEVTVYYPLAQTKTGTNHLFFVSVLDSGLRSLVDFHRSLGTHSMGFK